MESSKKQPKDDKVIIEELQTANSHLRKMVDTLFFELSACQEENVRLKSRIRELERQQSQSPHRRPAVGGYDGGKEDEEDDSYMGMQKIVPTEELPPLPPLDMPPAFNFGNSSPTPSSTVPSSSVTSDDPQPPPPLKYASLPQHH